VRALSVLPKDLSDRFPLVLKKSWSCSVLVGKKPL